MQMGFARFTRYRHTGCHLFRSILSSCAEMRDSTCSLFLSDVLYLRKMKRLVVKALTRSVEPTSILITDFAEPRSSECPIMIVWLSTHERELVTQKRHYAQDCLVRKIVGLCPSIDRERHQLTNAAYGLHISFCASIVASLTARNSWSLGFRITGRL